MMSFIRINKYKCLLICFLPILWYGCGNKSILQPDASYQTSIKFDTRDNRISFYILIDRSSVVVVDCYPHTDGLSLKIRKLFCRDAQELFRVLPPIIGHVISSLQENSLNFSKNSKIIEELVILLPLDITPSSLLNETNEIKRSELQREWIMPMLVELVKYDVHLKYSSVSYDKSFDNFVILLKR